ncbi:hypothetical protein NFI96_020812 [Prochilodus magdalenae]|nr:hypothetical protein NFI96_020812 [Prochilodus magdalenae]
MKVRAPVGYEGEGSCGYEGKGSCGMEDIDAMFTDMLEEMDLLTQSLGAEITEPDPPSISSSKSNSMQEINFSIGFTDLNASLNEMEDNDLDALMADLVADLNAAEEQFASQKGAVKESHPPPAVVPAVQFAPAAPIAQPAHIPHATPAAPPPSKPKNELPPCPAGVTPNLTSHTSPPPPPAVNTKPSIEDVEAQMKADKIKLALEKLKEAKVKKMLQLGLYILHARMLPEAGVPADPMNLVTGLANNVVQSGIDTLVNLCHVWASIVLLKNASWKPCHEKEHMQPEDVPHI